MHLFWKVFNWNSTIIVCWKCGRNGLSNFELYYVIHCTNSFKDIKSNENGKSDRFVFACVMLIIDFIQIIRNAE